MAMNPMNGKFENDELKMVQIKNKDLVCKDCRNKFDDTNIPANTSKCEKYDLKPDEVLDGGKCIEFDAE